MNKINFQGQLQKELCGVIYVDIDGVKGSNTLGKDNSLTLKYS